MQSLIKYAVLGLIFIFSLILFSDWWLYIVVISLAIFFAVYLELWEEIIAFVIVCILMIILQPIFKVLHLPFSDLVIMLGLWYLCKKYLPYYLNLIEPFLPSRLSRKNKRVQGDDVRELMTGSYMFSPAVLFLLIFVIGIYTLDTSVAHFYKDKQENLCGIVEKDSYSDKLMVKGEYKKHILSRYTGVVEVSDKVCVTYLPHEKSTLPKDYTYHLEDKKDIDAK